jgi:hypothetical protein
MKGFKERSAQEGKLYKIKAPAIARGCGKGGDYMMVTRVVNKPNFEFTIDVVTAQGETLTHLTYSNLMFDYCFERVDQHDQD